MHENQYRSEKSTGCRLPSGGPSQRVWPRSLGKPGNSQLEYLLAPAASQPPRETAAYTAAVQKEQATQRPLLRGTPPGTMGEAGPIPMNLPFRDLVSLAGTREVPVWSDIESFLQTWFSRIPAFKAKCGCMQGFMDRTLVRISLSSGPTLIRTFSFIKGNSRLGAVA